MFLERFLVCFQGFFFSLLLSAEALEGGEGMMWVGLGRVARLQGEETDSLRCGSKLEGF